jgi:ATP-binding cassette subfamily C (CFTR/MRP) protein 1
MEKIHKRVSHTASVIGNMKHLKISGLVDPVEDTIQKLRVDELKVGSRFRMLVCSVGIGFTPILPAPVFTFAVTSKDLNVTIVYTSVATCYYYQSR